MTLPRTLGALLWIIGIHETGWLVLDLTLSALGRWQTGLFDIAVHASLSLLVAATLMSNVLSARILSWELRVLGIVSVLGVTVEAATSRARIPLLILLDFAAFACLYLIAGFWLARSYKAWRQSPRTMTPKSTIPELDVQEPFVRYPRV